MLPCMEPDIPEEAQAEFDRSLDALLDELVADEIDDDEVAEESPEAESESAEGVDPQQDAADVEETSEGTQTEEATEEGANPPSPPPYDEEEMARARNALRRDTLPESVINAMAPEEVLTYGLKRAKVQEDTQRTYDQYAELSKRAGASAVATEATPVEPAASAPAIDVQSVASKLADSLDLDDGAAEALAGALTEIREADRKANDAKLTTLQQSIVQIQRSEEQRLLDGARDRLRESYPSAVDGAAFDDLVSDVREMAQTSLHSNAPTPQARLDALLETAALARKHKRVTAEDRQRKELVDAAKAGGSLPGANRTAQSVARKLTFEERMQRRIEMAASGKSDEEITAALGTS